MSKRSKRAKRERVLDNLAAARMARALKGERGRRVVRVLVTGEVDPTQAHALQRLESFARKWGRETPSANVEIHHGEITKYDGS